MGMWGNEDPPWTPDTAEPEAHPTTHLQGRRQLRTTLVAALALIVVIVGGAALISAMRTPTQPSPAAAHTASPTASVSPRDTAWRDVGLSADEQIVFSHSDAQTGYSCGVINQVISMHVTHDGGMSWRPLATPKPIASEVCTLAVDDTNPQQLAFITRTTKDDPCLAAQCTPTPCAHTCQPCVDYCPPPPLQTFTLHRSVNGGATWTNNSSLPNGLHFSFDIAFAGSTLYAWTGVWPTLLATSVAGGPFRLIDLSAYYPPPPPDNSVSYQEGLIWPLIGSLYVAVPGNDANINVYIATDNGGASWTRHVFTMNGDPVALRQGSGLDGRTLMGERINGMGRLALSTDGGDTWRPAPPPYPDFTQGRTECYASADGRFLWFNGANAIFGLGVYRAGPGATAWTKILDESQIEDISLDLVSYDHAGRMVALWGRESRSKWVVYQLR